MRFKDFIEALDERGQRRYYGLTKGKVLSGREAKKMGLSVVKDPHPVRPDSHAPSYDWHREAEAKKKA